MCEQEGLTVLGEDCDHIVPLEDGGDRYAKDNRWTICRRHHNGLKRALQEFARKRGMLDKLRSWCIDPATRPRQFRGQAYREVGRGEEGGGSD